ncbi:MAG TPA: hypothetical protein VMV83_13490 [Rectinemataceae bacterium]|nr:hypothetical protein [Rectinemataceae bacterium]
MTALRTACVASLLAMALLPASPQLLDPGSRLSRLETHSFDIYFPASLEPEARRLSGIAEGVLDAEVGRVGPRPSGRIPVLLADAFREQNGYFTVFPSTRIVLEIAPGMVDDELSSSVDPLRDLFAHELAHALSLSTRPPLFELGRFLFGDPVAPAFWLGPRLLAEGTAIAAESGGPGEGRGRTADPLSAAPILQELVENRRPGFWEASGAGGAWPFGSSPYAAGGPFASWLEQRYGEAALAKLWVEISRFRPLGNFLFVKGAFTVAFGENLDTLWKEYLDAMTPSEPLVVGPHLLGDTAPGAITAMAAGRGLTLWADAGEGAVFALGEGETKPRRLFDADGHVNRLDLSPDGNFLLLSTVVLDLDGRYRNVAMVWDLQAKHFTARKVFGIREAAWAGEAGPEGSGDLIGIAARGIATDLVRAKGDTLETILRGGPRRSFGSPVALGEGSSGEGGIAFSVREEGKSFIARTLDGKVEMLAPSVPLQRLRFLGGGGERLVAAYAAPKSLYRLVIVEAATSPAPRILFQKTELSGSVFRPAFRSSPGSPPALSYVSGLSDGQRPADYPFDAKALALETASASWVPLDPSFATDTGETTRAATTDATTDSGAALPQAQPAPTLPLAFSLYRSPYLSSDLASAGLLVQGMDIGETLDWTAQTGWNWEVGGVDAALTASLALPPWNLALGANDGFVAGLGAGSWWRSSSASLSLSRYFPGFPIRKGIGGSLTIAAGALAPASVGAPYASGYVVESLGGRASVLFTDSHESAFAPFEERGYQAGLSADMEASPQTRAAFAAEARLEGWLPFAGLHARLDAEASPAGLLIGPGGRSYADGNPTILAATTPTWSLFAGNGLAGPWYARTELSFRPLDIEIGRGFRPLGIEARRIILTAGARGGALGDYGTGGAWTSGPLLLASTYANLAFEFSPLIGIYSSVSFSASVEFEWTPLSNLAATPWRLAFLLGSGH